MRSFTSIRIKLIKIWHPRLAYSYKLKGHTKLRQNFLLFFREANFDSVFLCLCLCASKNSIRQKGWVPSNLSVHFAYAYVAGVLTCYAYVMLMR